MLCSHSHFLFNCFGVLVDAADLVSIAVSLHSTVFNEMIAIVFVSLCAENKFRFFFVEYI